MGLLRHCVFALPILPLVWATVRCAAAGRAGGPQRTTWRLAAGWAAATGASILLASVPLAPSGPATALSALSSALLLGTCLTLARSTLGGSRIDGMLDALVVAIVVLALAGRAVVIPGLDRGDALLTGVFGLDLLALLLAATVGVASPTRSGRLTGRMIGRAALLAAVGDGLACAWANGQLDVPLWAYAVAWAAAACCFARAAGGALRRRGVDGSSRDHKDGRWVAGRVVVPFVAATALPVAGLVRSAQIGRLEPWETVYFTSLSIAVLALAFARQGTLLLANARAVRRERALREESQLRNEELEALTGLATTMTQTLDEGPIVEQAFEVLHMAARATGSALFLTGETGRSVLVTTAGTWTGDEPGSREITRLSLAARGHAIGSVAFQRPATDPLRPDGLGLLQLLVDQLAVALQNARDYRERLDQATRDPLTGLYNRRFFFEALETEIRRTERYGASASLVLFDVDDFKTVNDTFGHAAGDDVLRRIAATVDPLLRPSDSFARIGGEEFALLLPETQQLDALLVADRIRTAIARAAIVPGRRVTVSGGVGTCPQDATTREDLLRRTDAALYWSKRNGKDICALAGDALDAHGLETATAEVERGAHLYALVASIDGQSRYTRDHSENVAAYATAVGRAMALDPERMVVLRRAALLHDIGKVAVPVGILSKPGRLDDRERGEIERHSGVGATMIIRAGLDEVARFVRHHHERFDGAGYPDGVAGEAIPLESRILFVCDSFEAMTSDRAYRQGMPVGEALAELRRCAGTQFDPEVVRAFEGLLDRSELPLAALRV